MGVPPNHPKIDHFSIETHGAFGSPILRNTPNGAHGGNLAPNGGNLRGILPSS